MTPQNIEIAYGVVHLPLQLARNSAQRPPASAPVATARNTLTAEERALCARVGMSEESYLLARNEVLARGVKPSASAPAGQLTAEEKARCTRFGISEANYLLARNEVPNV